MGLGLPREWGTPALGGPTAQCRLGGALTQWPWCLGLGVLGVPLHPTAFGGQTGLSWGTARGMGVRALCALQLGGMFLPGAGDSCAGTPAPVGPLLGWRPLHHWTKEVVSCQAC